MTMMRSELLEVIYRFYPRGVPPIARRHVPPGEPVYNDTEEHRRLVDAASRARAEYPRWRALIDRAGDRCGLQTASLHLFSRDTDPAYSARIWLTDDIALSFHMSLLGPYYGIHLPGIPEEEPVAREIAREIEATYPGYRQIPPEIGNEVVPDVAMDAVLMGEATIFVCLFSLTWTFVDRVVDAQRNAEVTHEGEPDREMGAAAYAANAISEACSALFALLDWNDKGAIGTPPMTTAEVGRRMGWLDQGLDKILHGEVSGWPSLVEADLERVRRLAALLPGWPSAGPLPPTLVDLAEETFRAILGGQDRRALRGAVSIRPAPSHP